MAKVGLEPHYLAAIRALLTEVMARHGLNQDGVERRIGIPQSQVSAVLDEKKTVGLGVPGLIRLCDFAGVSIDDALGRKVPKAAPVEPHAEAATKGTGGAAVRRRTGAKRGESPADVVAAMDLETQLRLLEGGKK